jgi:hypothetical protein
MNHQSRGQALVESALYLPLMLLSMFVLWWAAREAATHQRIYSALRYGAEITANTNPTQGLSLQTLYATTANGASYSQASAACSSFDVSLLQGTASTFHATTPRAPFFSPVKASANCSQTSLAMTAGYTRGLMLTATNGTISANIAAGQISRGYLSFLNTFNQVTISQTSFSGPDLKALTHCYAGVYSALNASLYEGAKGVNASTPQWSTSNPYDAPLPTTPIALGNGCNTSDPPGFSPNAPPSIPAVPPAYKGGINGLGAGGVTTGGALTGNGNIIQ